MRLNTPITQNEYPISDNDSIVSTTDLLGNITYANPYFIEVSGFTEEELIGSPQNIVRHPDMPVEAFADLWATIKSGLPWTGIVKNRCKNGDYYWVNANVTPVIENGQTVGYMSVRTKPSQQQIQEAEHIYKQLRNGNPNKIILSQGVVIRSGFLHRIKKMTNLSASHLLTLNVILIISSLIGLVVHMTSQGSQPVLNLTTVLILFLLCMMNSLFLWFRFQSTVVQPSQQALKASKIMAGGDLTYSVEITRTDELGQVLRMLRQLRVNLHSIVGDVRKNSEHILVATKEIAAGNIDLSGRTESQASSLEETAASMEEFAATVSQNADNANLANQMASQSLQVADRGDGGRFVFGAISDGRRSSTGVGVVL